MSDQIVFKLDGKEVAARAGETIWDVAKREGTKIPHLVPRRLARLPRRRQLPRLHGRGQGRARADGVVHPQADRRHGSVDAIRSAP